MSPAICRQIINGEESSIPLAITVTDVKFARNQAGRRTFNTCAADAVESTRVIEGCLELPE
jgi:hypothetical protein